MKRQYDTGSRYYENLRRGAENPCDGGYLALGFATIAECNDAMGTLGTSERECMANALDGHEDAGKDYLDCAIAAYQAYANCLEANVSCEPGAFDACTEDHGAAIAACPLLPDGVRPQFDACVP